MIKGQIDMHKMIIGVIVSAVIMTCVSFGTALPTTHAAKATTDTTVNTIQK